uniref:R13L1/DRL21-like LRR repeat region domain-containing protein n=1 Tax=Fagus sylvatica TaxID=28930 RepID=A0A2N9J2G1_FAGSY
MWRSKDHRSAGLWWSLLSSGGGHGKLLNPPRPVGKENDQQVFHHYLLQLILIWAAMRDFLVFSALASSSSSSPSSPFTAGAACRLLLWLGLVVNRWVICRGPLELPDSIGQLIHLRLLYVADTNIIALPKSLTKLYNLQTLRIKNCNLLKELPKDLSNLINLRHIYIDHKFINGTPKDIGQLISLQTLPFFTVNPDAGCSLEELGHLNQLSRELDIYNLEHVRDNVEAKSANLAKNAKIYKLGFHWGVDVYRAWDGYNNDEEVLEGLQPHQNLKSLTIEGYKGKKFPSWMLTGRDARDGLSLFDNLIEITLITCNKCEEVPTLGHLPRLKVLEINEMDNVRCIGTKFYSDGNNRNALFPTLRRLKLSSMINLVKWKNAKELTTATCEVFPCLEELIIKICHLLTSAPCHFPSLNKLEISYICSNAFENISSKLTTLTSLFIEGVSELGCLPEQLLQNNTSLMSLEISHCRELESISRHQDVWAFCTSLRSLHLWHCSKLSYIPDGLHKLISLHKLTVGNCYNLSCFPSIHGVMPLLRRLEISDCLNLISFPDLRGFSSLSEFEISNCRELRTFPNIEGFASLRKLVISLCGIEVLSIGLKSCTSLHYFKISSCPNLISIPDLRGFSSLTQLEILDCPKLRTFPSIEGAASLRELVMSLCDVEVLSIGLKSCTSLQMLRIQECQNLKRISEGLPESLKTLKIGSFCEMLEAFPSLISSTSIQHSVEDLYLNGWAKLNSLPDQFQRFTALKDLSISNFDGMEALPEWLGKLSSLQKLSLLRCQKLMYLPTAQAMRRLTYLRICSCPILEARCAEGSDTAERYNIAHIPTIIIGFIDTYNRFH